MTDTGRPTGSRWAPWWAHVVPIVALNWLRQALVPPADVGDAVSVALFAATTAVVMLLVTMAHRVR